MEMMLKNLGAKKLGEVCFLFDGPFGSDLLAEDYDEQGVPLLRMQNITESGSSNLEEVQLISQESAARMDKYHVFPGELVVTKIGFLGYSTVLPNDYPVYVFRREMTKMIPKNSSEFLPEALASFFNGRFGREQFYRYASGTTRDRILLISQREVLIPPLSNRLQLLVKGCIDSSKAAQKAAIDHINCAEQALLQALDLKNWQPPESLTYTRRASETLTAGRLDSDFFAPARYATLKKLAAMPHRLLSECCDPIRDLLDPTKTQDIAVVRNFDVTDALKPSLDDSKEIVEVSELGSTKKIMKPGDVAISRLRSYLRQIAVVRTSKSVPTVGSTEFIVLRPKKGISPELLQVFLRSQPVQTILKYCQEGNQHPRFGESNLLEIPFPVVLLEHSEEIIAHIRQAHAARQQAQALLAKAKRAVEVAIEEGEKAALILLAGKS